MDADAHSCAVVVTLKSAAPLQGWVAAAAAAAPIVIHLLFPNDSSIYRSVTKLAGPSPSHCIQSTRANARDNVHCNGCQSLYTSTHATPAAASWLTWSQSPLNLSSTSVTTSTGPLSPSLSNALLFPSSSSKHLLQIQAEKAFLCSALLPASPSLTSATLSRVSQLPQRPLLATTAAPPAVLILGPPGSDKRDQPQTPPSPPPLLPPLNRFSCIVTSAPPF